MVRADVAVVPGVLGDRARARKTALVRLDQFSAGAADDLKAALTDVKAAGADRIVFDLRGNPGGYVNEADAVASQFLKSGVVFIERAADGHETTHAVAEGGLATDLPLVVLVDGGTASSSEIVSGASRTPAGPRSSASRRTGPGRSSASSRSSDGSALRVGHGRMADPEGSPDLARGHHPRRRRRAGQRHRTARPGPGRQDDRRPRSPKLTDPQLAKALTVVTAVAATGPLTAPATGLSRPGTASARSSPRSAAGPAARSSGPC